MHLVLPSLQPVLNCNKQENHDKNLTHLNNAFLKGRDGGRQSTTVTFTSHHRYC